MRALLNSIVLNSIVLNSIVLIPIVIVSIPATALATLILDWDIDELVARADLVVIGTVGQQRYVEVGGRLVTESDILVEQSLKGRQTLRFVLTQLGGRDGDIIEEVVGTARLRPGQRFLLMTERRRDGRRYIVGLSLGAYHVDGKRLRQTIEASLINSDGRIADPPVERRALIEDVVRAIQRVMR